MTTEKLSELIKKPENRYCNFCKWFLPVRYNHRLQGSGHCLINGDSHALKYCVSRACNGFDYDIRPSYDLYTEEELADFTYWRLYICAAKLVDNLIQQNEK